MTMSLALVLKRDRLIVLAALLALTVLAWAWTAYRAIDMRWMVLGDAGWSAGYFLAMFVMWVVMMVGMMLPSAAPTILLYAALQRNRERSATFAGTALFTFGYLACWIAFSLIATVAQWGLANSGLLASHMMIRTAPALAGLLFLAAGIYQFTPLKRACLTHCRSPLHFLMHRPPAGRLGMFLTGVTHGAYCAGCCWALMALLFALGAMNLLWVVALTAFVLAEKLFPVGHLIARLGAVLMLGTGAYLLWAV